jgi:3-oxoacyl-[acyl-carrier protein] reductase
MGSTEVVARALAGKVALVTGASQGIGLGIAQRLSSDGALVVLADRNEEKVKSAAAEINSEGGDAVAATGDVRNQTDIANWIAAGGGHIDILVNNAAVANNKPFTEQTVDDWDLVVDVNLKGPFLTCKAVVPLMTERGGGSIINIASMAALQYGGVPHIPYTASKAGLLAMTRDLAHELGAAGIRVNAIAPGPILTQMSRDTLSDEVRDSIGSQVALRRWGVPEEVASVVSFLAGPESAFVTGVTLPVNGGMR